MLIRITASGRIARHIAGLPIVSNGANGDFQLACEPGTTLAALVRMLGLSDQALLCVVGERSIPTNARENHLLESDDQVALLPPIRAG